MSPIAAIAFWWVLFGGTHMLGSSLPVRTRLIRTLGMRGFKALYSAVALATFIPLCFTFFANKHAGDLLIAPPAPRWLIEALMLLAVVTLGQALAASSPLGTTADLTGRFPAQAIGILRVTRHPQNMGFAIFGVAHCLANTFAGDWVFFGGFVVYAIASSVHQDHRTLASGRPEVARFQAETSLLPFAAIAAGRQRIALREFSLIALATSVVAFGLLRQFHPVLFGGFGG